MDRIALIIATFGYSGFFPIAPGTAGSAAAVVLFAAIRLVALPAVEALAILIVLVIGSWAATRAERLLSARDPGPVVVDEVLGMLVTLAFLPATPGVVLAGFLLFRVFDVVKPFPVRRLESLPGGWGIMVDDLMAGLYAHAVLRLLLAVVPGWLL